MTGIVQDWKELKTGLDSIPEAAAAGWKETSWDRWLSYAMPDAEERRRLMVEFGHVAIRNPDGCRLILLHGTRGSGAAEFLHIVTSALGEYAGQIPSEIITQGDTIPYEHRLDILYQVRKRRLLYITDPPVPATFDHGRVYYMLGSGRMLARQIPSMGVDATGYLSLSKQFSIAMVTRLKSKRIFSDHRITDFLFTGYNKEKLCRTRVVNAFLRPTNQKCVDAWLADGARQWVAANLTQDVTQA